MKLLLDQNLSARLVEVLRDVYPETMHVREIGLERADDHRIWEFAKAEGYTILSKDSDFHQLSFLHGHPPKVVWIALGNCSTDQILSALRSKAEDLEAFEADEHASFLRLG